MDGALPLELTQLGQLEELLAGGTELSAPADPVFQAWLARVYKSRIMSQVRIFVAHLMSWTFSLAALGMITWFLRHAMYQDAMTEFSHVVAVVGPIVGFCPDRRAGEAMTRKGIQQPHPPKRTSQTSLV